MAVECGGSVLLEVADDDENLSYTLYADNGNSFSGTLDDAEKLRFDETVPSISNESGNGNSLTVSGNSLSDGDTFTIPDAPTIDSLVQNNDNSVDISFSVTNDGGSLITGYAVEYKKATDTTWNSVDFGTSTSGTISGLEYDVYEFRVSAENFMGTSDYSNIEVILLESADTTPPTFDTFPADITFEATGVSTPLNSTDYGMANAT
ncbi:MAG: fibronectin type III domain-containing protein, partial [Nitrosopumilus sp.]|nr:fibronectin type III domain-containing protein [Nitrosopumilus sp.]